MKLSFGVVYIWSYLQRSKYRPGRGFGMRLVQTPLFKAIGRLNWRCTFLATRHRNEENIPMGLTLKFSYHHHPRFSPHAHDDVTMQSFTNPPHRFHPLCSPLPTQHNTTVTVASYLGNRQYSTVHGWMRIGRTLRDIFSIRGIRTQCILARRAKQLNSCT